MTLVIKEPLLLCFAFRSMTILAGVEGGGTTFVVALARDDPTNIIEREEFPTTTPAETIGKCVAWLKQREYDSLGIATFGPVELHVEHKYYGFITTTPKPGWKYADVLGPLRAVRPNVPVGFDTDVNAPAVAEHAHLSAQAAKRGIQPPTSCCYITVGTGIGVGLVVNGMPVHGLMHPEGGHLCVTRHADDHGFEGNNPQDCFHGVCAENMACSGSLAKRANLKSTADLATLPDDHPVWDIAAHYLGALCANVTLLASPEKIVLSGGVMQRATLFPKVRTHMQALLNGYIQSDALTTADGIAAYVAPSTWGNSAGMVGALTLAQSALLSGGGGGGGGTGNRSWRRRARGPTPSDLTLIVLAAAAGALATRLALRS